jgi:signal transduction histidine kinase
LQGSAAEGRTDQESLQAIDTIIEAQVALIRKLKALARPSSEDPVPLELLPEVIQPAVQMVESWLRMRDRRHPVSVRLDGSLSTLPAVPGLRDDLVNLIVNLFLNARDAMPQGGLIRVSGRHDGPSVIVQVEDEGSGIPEAQLGSIFKPFFSTKGSGGMGMGLAMARDLMHRLRGNISAYNRAAGGACFELRFPLAVR